jgi:hypothetical protein
VNPTAAHLQRDSGDPSGIRIELFGQFRVAANGVPLAVPVTHRMQALLAYLLLNAGSSVPRQRLAFLFWPDTTEPQARTNLRQLLHHLRSAWQDFDGYIEMDRHVLRWRTSTPLRSTSQNSTRRQHKLINRKSGTIMRLPGRPWRNALPFIAETFYLRSMMNGSTRTANAFGKNMRMCSWA